MNDDPRSRRDPASDEADALRALRDSAPPLDHDAIWARVQAGVAATAQRGWPWWDPRGWTWRPQRAGGGAWLRAPLTAAVAAMGVVAIIVGATLVVGRGSTSAAVVEEVERLSAVASTALADDELSAGELVEIEQQTAALLQTIALQPQALSALDAAEIARVIAAVDAIRDGIARQDVAADTVPAVDLIEAVSEQARTAAAAAAATVATAAAAPAAVPTAVAAETDVTSTAVLPVCAGAEGDVASRCDRTFRTAVVTCQQASDRDALDACKDSVKVAKDACSDLPSKGQRKACERELKDVERDAQRRLRGNDDDRGRKADDDHDRTDEDDED